MTWNISLLMGIIKGKLCVDRQGWPKQRCSRNAARVDKQLHHAHALLRYTQDVWQDSLCRKKTSLWKHKVKRVISWDKPHRVLTFYQSLLVSICVWVGEENGVTGVEFQKFAGWLSRDISINSLCSIRDEFIVPFQFLRCSCRVFLGSFWGQKVNADPNNYNKRKHFKENRCKLRPIIGILLSVRVLQSNSGTNRRSNLQNYKFLLVIFVLFIWLVRCLDIGNCS